MGIFKDLTAEEVAAQHQVLIDILFQVVFRVFGDSREIAVEGIEQMIARRREAGEDTTILEALVASLGRQPVQEG